MTTIAALNVRLGMDASNFSQGVNLARNEVAKVTQIMRQSVPSTEKLRQELGLLDRAFSATGKQTQQYANAVDYLNKKYGETEQAIGAQNRLISGVKALAAAWLSFTTAKSIIRTAADVEAASVQFEVLTGSVAEANAMMQQMRVFAAQSPLSLSAVQKAGRTMMSFGVATEDVMARIRTLGDITGGNQFRFEMLALAYSQAAAAGRLMGQDLLQMVNAGFNPLLEISEMTGKSMLELKKEMEDGKISIDMVNAAMARATGDGGRFNGMTEKMAKTFDGSYQQMVGSAQELAAAIGADLLPIIADVFGMIQKMASAAKSAWESMTALDKTVLASVASFIAVVSVAGMVSRAIIGIVAAMKALNIAQAITLSLQGPRGWAILAGAAVAAGVAIYAVNRAMAKTEEVVAKNGETAKATAGAFAGLAASVDSAIAASVKASAVEATSLRKLLDANITFGEAAAELMQERARLMFGEEEYANIEARMKGMTDEQIKQLANMRKEIEALQAKKDLQEGFAKAQEEALVAARQYFAEERRADEERRKREIAGPMSVEVGSAEAARMAAEAWNARMAAPLKGEPTQKQFIDKAKELLVSQAEADKKQSELLTAVKKATETMLETRPKLFR